MTFQDKLNNAIKKNDSLVCVGLDSELNKIPESIKHLEKPQLTFNKAVIDATHDLVCSYKINSAFYEAKGDAGIKELKLTFEYIKGIYPDIPIILDAKRGDIGNTNNGYVKFAYEFLNADSITLNPYLGREALKPFLEIQDRGAIILCKTSNQGSGEFQDINIDDKKLYQIVAKKVADEWNTLGNCSLVVGATYPEELKMVREIVGDMTILVPGIGIQGGDIEKTIKAGLNSEKKGLIIHSARSIIFASGESDFAEKAREETKKLQNEINKYR